jgi:hypothetical protein
MVDSIYPMHYVRRLQLTGLLGGLVVAYATYTWLQGGAYSHCQDVYVALKRHLAQRCIRLSFLLVFRLVIFLCGDAGVAYYYPTLEVAKLNDAQIELWRMLPCENFPRLGFASIFTGIRFKAVQFSV